VAIATPRRLRDSCPNLANPAEIRSVDRADRIVDRFFRRGREGSAPVAFLPRSTRTRNRRPVAKFSVSDNHLFLVVSLVIYPQRRSTNDGATAADGGKVPRSIAASCDGRLGGRIVRSRSIEGGAASR